MVREEQLSLCFEAEADQAHPVPPGHSSAPAAIPLPTASVLCLRQFRRQHPAAADANSARLLKKIARKVKYF